VKPKPVKAWALVGPGGSVHALWTFDKRAHLADVRMRAPAAALYPDDRWIRVRIVPIVPRKGSSGAKPRDASLLRASLGSKAKARRKA